jgi:hypothetical protein
MGEFTINIPNGLLPGILKAFEHAYPIPVDKEGNPIMSQVQNARMHLRRYVREIYIGYESKTDSEAARLTAIKAAETASEDIEVN